MSERTRVSEEEIHILWEGLKNTEIFDENNSFFVAFPGLKSSGFGPDFRGAVIFVNGLRFDGDVECHVKASDWFEHKHHNDPNYSGVVFHVVWENDLPSDISLNSLSPTFTIELKKISLFNDGRKYLCSGVSEKIVRDEIRYLGIIRLRRKSERIRRRIEELEGDEEQALYEFVAEASGYEMFRNFNLSFARKYPLKIVKYIEDEKFLEILRSEFQSWNFVGQRARPKNHPFVRIPAVRKMFKNNHITSTVRTFFENGEKYHVWDSILRKGDLGGGIGKGRLRTIIANVFIPYLLATLCESEAEQKIIDFFLDFPPEETNRFLKKGMEILGLKKINMIEAQGIIEIFLTRCSNYLCFLCPLRSKH